MEKNQLALLKSSALDRKKENLSWLYMEIY